MYYTCRYFTEVLIVPFILKCTRSAAKHNWALIIRLDAINAHITCSKYLKLNRYTSVLYMCSVYCILYFVRATQIHIHTSTLEWNPFIFVAELAMMIVCVFSSLLFTHTHNFCFFLAFFVLFVLPLSFRFISARVLSTAHFHSSELVWSLLRRRQISEWNRIKNKNKTWNCKLWGNKRSGPQCNRNCAQ